jgi:hypothetical protein
MGVLCGRRPGARSVCAFSDLLRPSEFVRRDAAPRHGRHRVGRSLRAAEQRDAHAPPRRESPRRIERATRGAAAGRGSTVPVRARRDPRAPSELAPVRRSEVSPPVAISSRDPSFGEWRRAPTSPTVRLSTRGATLGVTGGAWRRTCQAPRLQSGTGLLRDSGRRGVRAARSEGSTRRALCALALGQSRVNPSARAPC